MRSQLPSTLDALIQPAVWPYRGGWKLGWAPVSLWKAATEINIDEFVADISAATAHREGFITGVVQYQAAPESPLAVAALYPPENTLDISPELIVEWIECLGADTHFALTAPFTCELSEADYLLAIDEIKRYLISGDCYQVNFARRYATHFQGTALIGFLRLLAEHPAPHASFFTLPSGDAVFGVSPERFLHIENDAVVTEPIKGSRARGADAAEDALISQQLANSEKDRAENLMIVDLLRNDLGRVCESGSISAEPLFEVRRFSNVLHLVSTVRGKLTSTISPLAALLSCFPGGSITGAPKKRAMEIIDELETAPRGFYCGSQFSLDGNGELESNILIRTFQTQGAKIYCHGGGGIVMDSDPHEEYLESEFKVRALMQTLESIR